MTREVLERVFDNARFAPSGGNRQGWRVIVVTDRELRRRMRELYQQPWDDYMVKTGAGRRSTPARRAGCRPGGCGCCAAPTSTRTVRRVPVHLVVCIELESLAVTDAALDRPSIVGGASIYPFVQNLLLGLRHEGLGASFTTLLVPAEPQLRELLAIPEGIAVAGHISVGHRADDGREAAAKSGVGVHVRGALWRALGLTASATRAAVCVGRSSTNCTGRCVTSCSVIASNAGAGVVMRRR